MKMCAGQKSKMAAISLKHHIFSHNFAILGSWLSGFGVQSYVLGSVNLLKQQKEELNLALPI